MEGCEPLSSGVPFISRMKDLHAYLEMETISYPFLRSWAVSSLPMKPVPPPTSTWHSRSRSQHSQLIRYERLYFSCMTLNAQDRKAFIRLFAFVLR